WAYFIRDGRGKLADYSLLTATLVAAVVIAGALSSPFIPGSRFVPTQTVVRIAIGMFAAAQLTLLFLIASDAEDPNVAANILAQWLRAFLFAAAALLAAGFIDSLGQSVYFKLKDGSLFTWITTTVGAALAGVAAFARQIAVLIGSKAR